MSELLYACLYQPNSIPDSQFQPHSLAAVAEAFSPRYEQHRDEVVVIDVSGLDRLIGPPRVIADELRRDAANRGLRVHVAVAATRLAALVLAHERPGVTVVDPGHEAAALASLPIRVLEQIEAAVEPRSTRSPQKFIQEKASVSSVLSVVNRWGLKTLGELAALPAADLRARLGSEGLRWQAMARGEDVRPLVPSCAEERFTSAIELEWPIEGAEPLSFVLTRLLEPLSTRLERRDRGAAALHVHLRLVTKEVHERRLQLPSPLRDVRTLRTLALLDLESHPPAAAIDHVAITIDPTPARILQHTLFRRALPTPEQLATLLARLGALMGEDRIGAPAIVDSYRPGAFAMKPFATDHESTGHHREHRVHRDDFRNDFAVSALSVVSTAHNETDHHREHGAHGAFYTNASVSSVNSVVDSESRGLVRNSAISASSALNVGSTDRDLGTLGTRSKKDSVISVSSVVEGDGSVVESDPRNPFSFSAGSAVSALNVVSADEARSKSVSVSSVNSVVDRDAPPAIVSALRRCRQPVPARVVVGADARPSRVTTDRRGFTGGSVVHCAGPWRSSGAWWESDGGAGRSERAGRPGGPIRTDRAGRTGEAGGAGATGGWNRDEWDVALSDGAVYRIFRDRGTEGWFIDAIVD